MSTDLPRPDYARNTRLVGYCDQGGRPDGVQIMVHRGYAYVGHMFSKGLSVIDVRDARNPRAAAYDTTNPPYLPQDRTMRLTSLPGTLTGCVGLLLFLSIAHAEITVEIAMVSANCR